MPQEIHPGQFLDWIEAWSDAKARLVILDGLPGVGKTHLIRSFGSQDIDLDDFLPCEKVDGETSWVTLVQNSGCIEAFEQNSINIELYSLAAPLLQSPYGR